MQNRFISATTLMLSIAFTAGAEASNTPAGFSFETTGAGQYLLLEDERTVYWHRSEAETGNIACLDACTEAWSPVLAPPAAAPGDGDWTTIERPDGGAQWSYKGKPLYTNIKDTFPGARLGAGRSWNILFEPRKIPAGMTISDTLIGRVMSDHNGRTLYTRANSGNEPSTDRYAGQDAWRPLEAPWLAQDQQDWTVQTNADGIHHWTYKGKSLFTYAKDKEAGDLYGHLKHGQWSAVILEIAPSPPPWVTVQNVEKGAIYADQNGITIYAPLFPNSLDGVNTCLEDCMENLWRPILASPNEKPTGLWTIHEHESGDRQWAHNGRLLYKYARDTKPRDMNGDGFGIGYRLGGGLRVILVESGLRPPIQ